MGNRSATNGTEAYENGAVPGADNWIYISTLSGNVSWAKIEISSTSFNPLLYVHDPADPNADITLP